MPSIPSNSKLYNGLNFEKFEAKRELRLRRTYRTMKEKHEVLTKKFSKFKPFMSLHTSIKEELKTAMKAHDAVKLRTVRSMLTAFTNELVATSRTPQSMLEDNEVLAVIKRLAKQRKESIVQYEAGNRQDLADPEKEELAVLESYLPQMMSQRRDPSYRRGKDHRYGRSRQIKDGNAYWFPHEGTQRQEQTVVT
jgi:hypothetical protein